MADDGRQLCVELDRLFKNDPLIDELAFLPSVDPVQVFGPAHEQVPTEKSERPDAFLLAEHKLAVSAKALVPIYFSAAKALPG